MSERYKFHNQERIETIYQVSDLVHNQTSRRLARLGSRLRKLLLFGIGFLLVSGLFAYDKDITTMLNLPSSDLRSHAFDYNEERIAIYAYSDSVFPNDEVSKFQNIKYLFISFPTGSISENNSTSEYLTINSVRVDTLALAKMKSLRYLEIVGVDINCSVGALLRNSNLIGLSLNCCKLFDSDIEDVKSTYCKFLDFSFNHISSSSAITILNNPALVYLSLSYNAITTLDANNLPCFKYLCLGKSYFGNNVSFANVSSWPSYNSESVLIDAEYQKIITMINNKKVSRVYISIERIAVLQNFYNLSAGMPLGKLKKLRIRCSMPECDTELLYNERIILWKLM